MKRSSCSKCHNGAIIKIWAIGNVVLREINIEKPELGEKEGVVVRKYKDSYHSELYDVDFGKHGIHKGLLRHGINQNCTHRI